MSLLSLFFIDMPSGVFFPTYIPNLDGQWGDFLGCCWTHAVPGFRVCWSNVCLTFSICSVDGRSVENGGNSGGKRAPFNATSC